MTAPVLGWCSDCFRWMRIKSDGTLRHHGGPDGSGLGFGGSRRAYRCDGAGTRPVATRPAGTEVPR